MGGWEDRMSHRQPFVDAPELSREEYDELKAENEKLRGALFKLMEWMPTNVLMDMPSELFKTIRDINNG